MDLVTLCVGLLLGTALGALALWLAWRGRWQRTAKELQCATQEQIGLQVRLEEREKQADEKVQLLQQAETRLRETFSALSSEALRNNNQSFLDLARASLGEFQQAAILDLDARQKSIAETLMPIRESLQKVDLKIQDVEKERIGAYAGLMEQVQSLATTQQKLQGETANLVRALRAPTVRGRWGEIQLRRVVEMAGLLEHCDFLEQHSVNTEEGRLRPDVLVCLPGGKKVVIDAKAPLAAYLDAMETTDEPARQEKLRLHGRQVRDHITRLGGKAYWEQFQPSPEFVVMFLPGETFFHAALQVEPDLIEYGVERKVIPSSPTTLIALLRAVAYGWRQEALAKHAEIISDLGKTLYKRLCVAVKHLNKIGTHLASANAAYNETVGSLERQVFSAARRFRDLGASGAEELPPTKEIEGSPRQLNPPDKDDEDIEDLDEMKSDLL